MYKLCKTEQSAKRQRAIEAALFEMMRSTDYSDISITDLCEKMGIPRKAFYRYFDSKDDVIDAILDHMFQEYKGFHTGVPPERRSLTAELEEYFKFWYKNRALLDAFTKNKMLARLMDTSINYPVGSMISVAKFLPEDNEQTRRQVFRFAICGLTLMMIDWYERGFTESFYDMANYACRTLSKPLFPELERLGFS